MKKTLLAVASISVAAFAYANTSSDSSELVSQQCKISAEAVSTLKGLRYGNTSIRKDVAGLINLNLKVQENNVALMVDSIGDIVTFNTAELVLPPAHLSGQFQEAILGAFRLSKGLLIILDTGAILRNAQNPQGLVLASLQPVSTPP